MTAQSIGASLSVLCTERPRRPRPPSIVEAYLTTATAKVAAVGTHRPFRVTIEIGCETVARSIAIDAAVLVSVTLPCSVQAQQRVKPAIKSSLTAFKTGIQFLRFSIALLVAATRRPKTAARILICIAVWPDHINSVGRAVSSPL